MISNHTAEMFVNYYYVFCIANLPGNIIMSRASLRIPSDDSVVDLVALCIVTVGDVSMMLSVYTVVTLVGSELEQCIGAGSV